MNKVQKFLAVMAILASGIAMAQISTGTPPFGSFGGGPFDTVNLGNLNVHFTVPVLHKAGRGVSFVYDLSYDSSIWFQATVMGRVQWTPTANWGWTSSSLAVLGSVSTSTTSAVTLSGRICPNGQFGTQTTYTTTYTYVDAKKSLHPFPGSTEKDVLSGGCTGTTYGPGFAATTTDGSGYNITVTVNQATGATTFNIVTRSGITVYNGNGTYTDTNGNRLTVNNGTGQFFDTLSSTTAVLTQAGSGTPTSPITYTYKAPSGGNAAYTVNYTPYTVQTAFGVSGVFEYGPTTNNLVSSIQLPDGTQYSFTYEAGPTSCSPCVTGRIHSVTLPTGGTINYQYTGGSNGIESDGSTAGLNRTLTPGGEWQYSRALQSGSLPVGPGSRWTTTVIDPSSNYTVLNFAEDSTVTNTTSTPQTIATYNFYETQRSAYQGSVSSNNCSSTNPNNCLLLTTTDCYNGVYSNCATATVGSPITQRDYYSQPAGGQTRLSDALYNGYGLVYDAKEFDYGVSLGAAPGTAHLIRETATTFGSYNGTGCTALTGIQSKPCQVTIYDWTSGSRVLLALSSYTYDQGTVAVTSGTPQHVSVSGSRGNVTTAKTQTTSGGSSLSKTFTYYDTGNPSVATDVNGGQSTYVYGSGTSCGNSFPTQINEPLSLSRSLQWNCTGGVATQVTDENQQNVTSAYTDSAFWRPLSVTDQLSNQTNLTYSGQIAVESALQNFNGGNSASDSLTTVDGFGRPAFAQRKQAPSSSNYDTVETDYNNLGQPYRSTMPYTATASPSSGNNTIASITRTYDALGRVLTITDANGGQVSYTYTANDVLQKVSGGKTFQKQFEYDGLGRLTSVCEISATLAGVGTCGQTTSQTGYWTKYTYDGLGRLLTVTQNAQAATGSRQTRSFVYDMLGRMTSESNPEIGRNGVNGTITYTYDSITPCADGVNYSYPGDLVRKQDNAGNYTCYKYDALHRVTQQGNTSASNTTLRKFFYDSEASYPTGVTVAYGKTHMVEAQTINTSNLNAVLTDEFFSYDKRGELTDVYESTPHSGGYYHSSVAYWANGVLNTLSLLNSSGAALIPLQTYGLDSEGRTKSVSAASGQNPVTSATYSTGTSTAPMGALTGVTFGSADSDAFTYDPNTGRMATYTFSVNGKTDVGTLTWNANGTVQRLVINDQIPSTTDSGTCNYGYDDVQRISNVTCGTFWVQNFSYDPFGNITKNVPQGDGGQSFLPSYWTSPPTNQFTSLPGVSVQYDANGNLLTDNLNTYTWDSNWGTMLTVSTGSTTVNASYDALGRMVENNAGGSYTEFVYGPTGKLAKCNGQSLLKAFVALPGGAKAIYTPSGLSYYRHSDWLGSSRLTSTAAIPTSMYSSSAYAPFGEQYKTAGSTDASFTGQDQDTVSNLYDFLARRYSASQGRWISPDPLGRGAVTLTNPQSWNRYVYVNNNPLRLVDAMGLDASHWCPPERSSCGGSGVDDSGTAGGSGGGGGGGGGGSDNTDEIGGGDDGCSSETDENGNVTVNCTPIGPPPCSIVGAGIGNSAGDPGFSQLPAGTMAVFPYGNQVMDGGNAAEGAASVAAQALFGPNSSTYELANALNAEASVNNNIVLTLYSGDAQSFATGVQYGLIPQSTLNTIQMITYISPGAPGGFARTNIPTYTFQSLGGNGLNGVADIAVDFANEFPANPFTGAQYPGGVSQIPDCGHDFGCESQGLLPTSSDCQSVISLTTDLPETGEKRKTTLAEAHENNEIHKEKVI